MKYHRENNSPTSCQNNAKNAGIIIKTPTDKEIAEMKNNPIWGCDVSVFDWHYDSEEHCLLLKGEVTLEYGDSSVCFAKGDYCVFPKGLSCVWKVTESVSKHYIFK